MFRGFDEMRSQMEIQFEEQLKNFQSTAPKELVREYQTPEGGKVREVGPIVYGYSMTIGPDGKPKIREFGNVRSSSPLRGGAGGGSSFSTPLISPERQPLADVITTDTEVKVVVEMPGANKENIKVNAYDSSVEITATGQEERKYREIVEIPPETDIETAKSIYKNGILEITFKKKEQTKPKGKQINVE
jgi:HSP20 family protein